MTKKNTFQDYTTDERNESVEALNNLQNKKSQLLKTLIFFGIIINGTIIILYNANTINFYLAVIICFFGNGILYETYKNRIKPYKEILKNAQHNDQVRQDERIRLREREKYSQVNEYPDEYPSEEEIIRNNLLNAGIDKKIAEEIEILNKMEKK